MKRRGVPYCGWLALGLSLGVHALLFVPVFLPAGGRPRAPAALAVETCVVAAEENLPPESPAPPPAKRASPPAAPEGAVAPRLAPESAPGPVPLVPTPADMVPAAPPLAANDGGGEEQSDAGSGGGRPGVSLFQVTAEGRSVVYVIDRSVSMGLNGGLAAAKREVLASLEQLPPGSRFQLVFYNRDAELLRLEGRASLLPVSPSTRASAARFLEVLRASGSTDHLEALKRALALQPDVIFLVTDADDLTAGQVRIVTAWNQDRTAIHAIELSAHEAGPEEGPLALLARSNRGTYRLVPLAGGE